MILLSLNLQGMPINGPSNVAFACLIHYFGPDICHITIDYNFRNHDEILSYLNRIKALVDMFGEGEPLERYIPVYHIKPVPF